MSNKQTNKNVSFLELTNSNVKAYKLDKKKALKLELLLNTSPYGKKWNKIGDILYDFSIGKELKNYQLEVTLEQYNYLIKELLKDDHKDLETSVDKTPSEFLTPSAKNAVSKKDFDISGGEFSFY